MATGSPKTRWNGKNPDIHAPSFSENVSEISLSYTGKRPEYDLLHAKPAVTQILWSNNGQPEKQISNRLYYGNNVPILASLLQDPTIKI